MMKPKNTSAATNKSTKKLRLGNKTMRITLIKNFKEEIERQEIQVDTSVITAAAVEVVYVDLSIET